MTRRMRDRKCSKFCSGDSNKNIPGICVLRIDTSSTKEMWALTCYTEIGPLTTEKNGSHPTKVNIISNYVSVQWILHSMFRSHERTRVPLLIPRHRLLRLTLIKEYHHSGHGRLAPCRFVKRVRFLTLSSKRSCFCVEETGVCCETISPILLCW